ncbi:hypothetical protein AX16_010175 [Volvariella volvacea WC 439]|nr:hypothetical protein AX16_010175 [Volvariella volvacea WC 439]
MSSSREHSSPPEVAGGNENGSWLKGKRIARDSGVNPKTFGHISGVLVGATFADRVECSNAGVHGPLRAGIHGTQDDGAYSIVLSGGYEDDEDHGDIVVYTGQGGRGKGSKLDQMQGKEAWDGPQVADQEWTRGNKALKISKQTGRPVRVIRGSTLNSRYAPPEGYRYDGLYIVTDATRARGKTGFMTCRFRLERVPGQPPIPGMSLGRTSFAPIASSSYTRHEPKNYAVPRNTQQSTIQESKPPMKPGPASAKPPLPANIKPGPFSAGLKHHQVMSSDTGTISRPLGIAAKTEDSKPATKPTVDLSANPLSALFGDRDPRLGPPQGSSKRPGGPITAKPSTRQPLPMVKVDLRRSSPPAKKRPLYEEDDIEDGDDPKSRTPKKRRTDSPGSDGLNLEIIKLESED